MVTMAIVSPVALSCSEKVEPALDGVDPREGEGAPLETFSLPR